MMAPLFERMTKLSHSATFAASTTVAFMVKERAEGLEEIGDLLGPRLVRSEPRRNAVRRGLLDRALAAVIPLARLWHDKTRGHPIYATAVLGISGCTTCLYPD